jgi:hypothetical protein
MVEQRVPLPILISGTASFKEGGSAMSRFNVKFARSAGRGPLATEAVPSGQTHEGGTGCAWDARSELFLRATASFAGEDSFYEEAAVRDGRMRELVSELATDADRCGWELSPYWEESGRSCSAGQQSSPGRSAAARCCGRQFRPGADVQLGEDVREVGFLPCPNR